MYQPLAVVLLSLCTVSFAENLGHKITNFVDNVGRGAEKLANDVADSVDRFVTDNEDLDMKRRAENQQAIDAYRRGEINESQLRTAMWISQYEYQQAMDDRIRNKYAGGNSYGGYYGTPPTYNTGGYGGQQMRDPGYGSSSGYNSNPYGSNGYSTGYSNPVPSQTYSNGYNSLSPSQTYSNGYSNPTDYGNSNNNNAYGTTTYYNPGNGIGIFKKEKKEQQR